MLHPTQDKSTELLTRKTRDEVAPIAWLNFGDAERNFLR